MNNRSKFRVWDLKNKKFLPESYFAILGNGKLIVTLSGYYNDFTNTNQDDYVVQQYTGLTDINGKEIYKGDIVKYNPDKPNIERIGIIEFSNYYKGWSIKDSHCYPLSDFGVYSLASPFLSFNWTEIVGNIFEHENLLK